MSYRHKMYLLNLVDELKLHPRLAKLRARAPQEEWKMLEKLIAAELNRLAEEEGDLE